MLPRAQDAPVEVFLRGLPGDAISSDIRQASQRIADAAARALNRVAGGTGGRLIIRLPKKFFAAAGVGLVKVQAVKGDTRRLRIAGGKQQ